MRLAEQLGISRTPIRQALMRLEGEGLLQKSGSRHYFVRRVELQEYTALRSEKLPKPKQHIQRLITLEKRIFKLSGKI